LRLLYGFFAFSGVVVIAGVGLIGTFFIYDATTYFHDSACDDIPVAERALNPRRGGPKNLCIADVYVDDHDSEIKLNQKDKPKLVILGSGWGSVALLKTINPGDYHITVISPNNYFLFTPMLPSATVGTLGLRSLVEPVRLIVQRVGGHFLRAEAVDVEFTEKLVEISQVDANGNRQNCYIPYDKLVIAVGT
jgi:NADH dehydrogenase